MIEGFGHFASEVLGESRAMRLIVACEQCRQQYDASGLTVGAKFRCGCGGVVTVAEPQGHDAAVVRCSSCGAPRDEGASACSHCQSDFTIHETDLHAVCPQCLARISQRAKFCGSITTGPNARSKCVAATSGA